MTKNTGEINIRWAFALLDGLAAEGLRHVVISPGSRSTPLVVAAERHPDLTTHVILDERSAGFYALGVGKGTGMPVALVCTSGTAAANWHPAVLEADAGKIPLILISADRPHELRGCGANQTTDQIKLFGNAVRAFHELPPAETDASNLAPLAARLIDRSQWPHPGPVHINAPFREPLLPDTLPELASTAKTIARSAPIAVPPPRQTDDLAKRISGLPGLIVCGWDRYRTDFPPAVSHLAQQMGAPVLADPLSNLRARGGPIIGGYDSFLRNEQFTQTFRPQWIIRFGALPVSKSLSTYLESLTEAEHILVDSHGVWQDPLNLTTTVLHADPATVCYSLTKRLSGPAVTPGWLTAFQDSEKKCADLDTPSEAEIVRSIAGNMPEGGTLFCGNSLPIRLLDSFLPAEHNRFGLKGCRGLSGIDGNVSITMGLGAATAKPAVALLGDLTLAHDLTALSLGRRTNVTLVVLNNDGGGIFEFLPQAMLDTEIFERYWLTPAAPNLEKACGAYDCRHYHIDRPTDFDKIFCQAVKSEGTDVIEIVLDRKESTEALKAYWTSVANMELNP